MNKKLAVSILVILILGVGVGNWVYGSILGKRIKTNITEKVSNADMGFDLEIKEVKVNPLLSKIDLKGLKLTSKDGKMAWISQEVDLDMPYSEAMRLLKSKQFEEIHSFALRLNDSRLMAGEVEAMLTLEELTLDFDGQLTRAELEKLNETFPQRKQRLQINAENIEFSGMKQLGAIGFTADDLKKISTVDRVNFYLLFHPKQKELKIRNFAFESPVLAYRGELALNYKGEGLDTFKPEEVSSDASMELSKDGIEWGDPEKTGRFTLAAMSSKAKGRMQFKGEKPEILEQESTFDLKGLKLEFAGKRKVELEARAAILGLKMDVIEVSRIKLDSKLKNNHLEIRDGVLKSNILNAALDVDIKVNQANTTASEIKTARLVISDLVEGLKNGLSTVEMMFGRPLPREGENIVLEARGTLGNPQIKGIHY